MTNNEIIARWLGWKRLPIAGGWEKPCGARTHKDHFDLDITLWHDGLLQKIEERGIWDDFTTRLVMEMYPDGAVLLNPGESFDCGASLMRATPAQLTAALVATIEEVA